MDRIVLVGSGGFGRCWRDGLRAHDDVEVVAVVEPDPEERDEAARHFGLPAHRVLHPDTAADWSPYGATAVIDSSPPWLHLDHAGRAFSAGLDLLVAKPMAPSLQDATRMATAARSAGRSLAVAQQMRYFPCFVRLREELACGRWGNVVAVSVAMALDGRGWTPGSEWRLAMANPLLLEAAIHHVDLLRHCLGREVSGVQALTWNPPWSPFTGDAACSALLTTADGVPISYTATFAPGPGEPPIRFDSGWTLVCTGGVLTVEDGGLRTDGTWLVPPSVEPVSLDTLNAALLADWLVSRREGAEPPFGARDNLLSLTVLQQLIDTSSVAR
jgi:predicted dehydrogenase